MTLRPGSAQFRTRLLMLLVGITLLAVLLSYFAVNRTSRNLHKALLEQARVAALSIDPEQLQDFHYSAHNLEHPSYHRIREQMAGIRAANTKFKSVHLICRQPDGRLRIHSDNDSGDAAENSTMLKPSSESCSAALASVLDDGVEHVVGPVHGPNESRFSALVPVRDQANQLSGKVTLKDAIKLVDSAEAFYKEHGRARFLEECNKADGRFRAGSLYAFAYDQDMTMQAHPVKPELVGKNLLNEKDWSGGKFFRREIQTTARENGSGWVDYQYENPANGLITAKTTYVRKVDDLIICAGAYKGSGKVLSVLRLDVNAHDWYGEVAAHSAFSVGLVLVLLLVVMLGMVALMFGLLQRNDAELVRQQQHTVESEARYKMLAQHSRTITWEVDHNARYVYISHVAEQILGYRVRDLVGKKLFEDLHPADDRQCLSEQLASLLRDKVSFTNLEHKVVTADGQIIWMVSNGIPLLREDGSLRGFQGSDTDITQRKLVEEKGPHGAGQSARHVRLG
ncbi:MAG: PAS domain S-box protein, partial [Phycisphaerales bacterium]|nr:PAS domain S-box protein [Phycisphaerales bacterium]